MAGEFIAHVPSQALLDRKTRPDGTVDETNGGIGTNTATSFALLADYASVRLLGSVGNDHEGDRYQERLLPKLGQLYRSDKPTGFVAYDIAGNTPPNVQRGAALDIKVPHDLAPADLVILEAPFFRPFPEAPDLLIEVKKVTDALKPTGILAFNLSGVAKGKTEPEALMIGVDSFNLEPEKIIAFGNEEEIKTLGEKNDPMEALEKVLPGSRLVVMTQDNRGAVVRFTDKFGVKKYCIIPACLQNRESDSVGVGDGFMGTGLAYLFTKPIDEWDETHMAHALYTASQAASFIVSSPHSQLQKEDATKVQSFHETNTDYTSAQWVTI